MYCVNTVSPNGKYIIQTVTGYVSRRDVVEYHVRGGQLGKENGIHLFLFDYTGARNTDSPIDQYLFVHNDLKAHPEIDKTAVIALLVYPSDHTHDFIETVALNAGVNIRVFRDREKAIDYLLSHQKNTSETRGIAPSPHVYVERF